MIKNLLFKITSKIGKFPIAHQFHHLREQGLLTIGCGTYGTPIIDFYKGSETKITIGNYTSIGPNVRIIAGGIHPFQTVSQYPFRSKFNLPGKYEDGNPSTNGNIEIGSDVWIGTGVTIMSGVKIGDGAIVGANSVVMKDIPDFAIAFGIPAKVTRFRFNEKLIAELKNISWWNWPESLIIERVSELTSENIELFINKYRNK